MLVGLDKIKRLIAVHAELPRGLTAKLMEFMEPFAGISTLRRRLGQDRDEDKAPALLLAPAAPAAVAAPVAAPAPAAPAVAAAPKARLRLPSSASLSCVQVLMRRLPCAAPRAAGGEGGGGCGAAARVRASALRGAAGHCGRGRWRRRRR